MPRERTVQIRNDEDSEMVGEVLESSVPVWVENGWTVVDDGDNDADDESVTYVDSVDSEKE